MVQVRDLVIGGGTFGVESPVTEGSSAAMFADTLSVALEGKMQRDADAYNIKAETDLQLFGIESLQKTINEVENPEDITLRFFETYQQKYNELLASAPNQMAKDKLSRSYENLRGSFGQRAISAQADEVQNMRVFGVQESIDKVGQAMINGTIDYKTARDMSSAATKQSEAFLSPTKRYELKKNAKQNLAELAWSNTPDEVKFQALLNAAPKIKGGFESALQLVHANEGGYAKSDGASGQPVMMGINKGSHEQAFNEIMQIYNTKGEAAAKQYADNFYKANYWDKYGIDQLPEDTQAIAIDGVINHWSGFQKELVAAAKGGASPAELIEMRRKEYERLVNSPGKEGDFPWRASEAGWETRMDNIEAAMFGKTGTAFDDLDVGAKSTAINSMKKYAETQEYVEQIRNGEALYMEPSKRKDAAEQHFKEYVAQKFQGAQPSGADVIESGIEYATTFNVVPPAIKNTFSGMINSGDVNQMMLGSDAIVKIMDANTTVGNEFPDDVQKKAILIQNLNSQGVPARKIADRLSDIASMRPEERAIYDSTYNEYSKTKPANDFIKSQRGFWSGSLPEMPAGMIVDFENEAKALMPYYNDVEASRKYALQNLERSWNVSYISGEPKWVKFAPERRHGIKGMSDQENAEWMRAQIVSQYYKENLVSDVEDELQIHLSPNRTDKNYYNVVIIADNGLINKMLYKPDPSEKLAEIQEKFNADLIKTEAGWEAKRRLKQKGYDPMVIDWKVGNVPTP
jgi:hypothetical protein